MKSTVSISIEITLVLNYVQQTANMYLLVFTVMLTKATKVSCFETTVETVPTLIALTILCIPLKKTFGTRLYFI